MPSHNYNQTNLLRKLKAYLRIVSREGKSYKHVVLKDHMDFPQTLSPHTLYIKPIQNGQLEYMILEKQLGQLPSPKKVSGLLTNTEVSDECRAQGIDLNDMSDDEARVVMLNAALDVLTRRGHIYSDQYQSQDIINTLESLDKGYCSGITALWVAYKKNRRLDYFYHDIIDPILGWDGQAESLNDSKDLQKTLEATLSQLILFQASISNVNYVSGNNSPSLKAHDERFQLRQIDYDKLIQLVDSTDGTPLEKIYTTGFVFTESEYARFLLENHDVFKDKYIKLDSTNHTMGLVISDDGYTLFDSNGFTNSNGQKVFEKHFIDVHELCQEIKAHYTFTGHSNNEFLPIAMNIFGKSGQDSTHSYPSPDQWIKTILDERSTSMNVVDNIADSIKSGDNSTSRFMASKAGDLETVKYLLQQGANPLIENEKGQTAIHIASQHGMLPIVKALTEHLNYSHESINIGLEQDNEGVLSPLCSAVKGTNSQLVQFLLDHGAEISTHRFNALIQAIDAKNIRAIKQLVKHKPKIINEPVVNSNGFFPIHAAVLTNDPDIINLILNLGADPDQIYNQFNPLMTAIANNKSHAIRAFLDHPLTDNNKLLEGDNSSFPAIFLALNQDSSESVKVLSTFYHDISQVTYQGFNVLHFAAFKGSYRSIEVLKSSYSAQELKNIANTANNKGQTPLEIAIQQGNIDTISALLDIGADPMLKIPGKPKPFIYVLKYGTAAMVKAMLDHEPELAQYATSKGNNILHLACSSNQTETVQILLDNHPELLDEFNDYGYSPTTLAAKNGHIDIIKCLLDHDPSLINTPDDENMLPIHSAIESRHLALMNYLLAKEPSLIQEKNVEGRTPFQLALALGHSQCAISLLRQFPGLIHSMDTNGKLPIHIAAQNNYPNIMRSLITHGNIDYLTQEDSNGLTAIQLAVQNKNANIIQILVEAGAYTKNDEHLIRTKAKTEQIYQNIVNSLNKKNKPTHLKKNLIDKDYPNLAKIRKIYVVAEQHLRRAIKRLDALFDDYDIELRDSSIPEEILLQQKLVEINELKTQISNIHTHCNITSRIKLLQNLKFDNSDRKNQIVSRSEALICNLQTQALPKIQGLELMIANRLNNIDTHISNPKRKLK